MINHREVINHLRRYWLSTGPLGGLAYPPGTRREFTGVGLYEKEPGCSCIPRGVLRGGRGGPNCHEHRASFYSFRQDRQFTMQAVPVAWGLRAPLKDIMEATESAKFVERIKGSSRAHARVLADGKIKDKEWGGADLWKTVEVTWTVTHDGVTHPVPFSSTAHMSDLQKWKVQEGSSSGVSKPPKPKAKRAPKKPAQQPVDSDESSSDEDKLDLIV